MRFNRCFDTIQFEALAEHRNLLPASYSFLQASECDHICSRPRRSAMVTAWVRSLALSLSTRFLMWKLTVVPKSTVDPQSACCDSHLAYLAKALGEWRKYTNYRAPGDGGFRESSCPRSKGVWAQSIMRNLIRPVAVGLGITERVGTRFVTRIHRCYGGVPKQFLHNLKVGSVHPSRVTLEHVYPCFPRHKKARQQRKRLSRREKLKYGTVE
jgi:hypothetical protein